MALPPRHPDDFMNPTPSENGGGFFFQTLRQANASAAPSTNGSTEQVAETGHAPRTPGSIATAVADDDTKSRQASQCGGTTIGEHDGDLEKGVPDTPAPAACPRAAAAGSSSPGLTNASQPAADDKARVLPCGRVVEAEADSKHDRGWRRIVRNFTPSWFAVVMGTGVVAILLRTLPYNAEAVRYISHVVFGLNVLLFVAFSAITAARYTLYPEIWGVMIKHPSQSLFLGCIPMGFGTLVKLMVYDCARWGTGFVYFTWACWWLEVAVACACGIIIPFVVVHHHRNQLSHMTAALLLPVVPVIVAAASGGLVAEVLPDPSHAVTTLVASYILWGVGEAFALIIMTVYFLRLQIHDLPPREVIVSVFLPIGPLGQGGFAIQQLGKVAYTLVPATGAFNGVVIDSASASASASDAALTTAQAASVYGGTMLYTMGIVAGMFLWGTALGWLMFAIISILTTKHFPFNMGWWGFVFPLGVLTSCTALLGTELDSTFFRVVTMMLSACVFCLWALVAAKTVAMVWRGQMFYAPCLRDLGPKQEAAGGDRTI